MMGIFDTTDENVKDMRGEVPGVGQKVDAHALSIKHLDLQMNQLFTNVNLGLPSTVPGNTALHESLYSRR